MCLSEAVGVSKDSVATLRGGSETGWPKVGLGSFWLHPWTLQ